MADYTYDQLKVMKVTQLREIALTVQQHEAVQGYSTMHKEQLLPALCKALGIHVDHSAHGAQKTKIKGAIHKLVARRDELMAGPDKSRVPAIRTQIHALKRKLRRMAETKA